MSDFHKNRWGVKPLSVQKMYLAYVFVRLGFRPLDHGFDDARPHHLRPDAASPAGEGRLCNVTTFCACCAPTRTTASVPFTMAPCTMPAAPKVGCLSATTGCGCRASGVWMSCQCAHYGHRSEHHFPTIKNSGSAQ